MITHRNAYLNTVGTLAHFQMSPADRYLWTLPMFHANGWTFVWTVTAAGATHVCLRKVDPARIFDLVATEKVTTLCAAPTVLIGIANAPEAARNARRGKVVRVLTAGAPPAAATIERIESESRLGGHARLRPHRDLALHPRLRAAARAWALPMAERAIVKARQGVELVSSGEIRVGTRTARKSRTTGRRSARSACAAMS